jgi:flagellar biosynthesis protein FlgN
MNLLLPHVLAQKTCLESFLAVLQAEEEAISGGRFAELPAITERKTALLARIAEVDLGREAAQAQLGLEPGRRGAECAAGADDALRDAWCCLLLLAERARELNRRLASKVYTHLEFTRNALAFLQARGQPLYGRDGAARAAATRASIAVG